MAFESLTERLQQAMGKIRKKGKVSEADVKEMMREIRLALLEADVNLQVVKDFTKRVRERAVGAEVLESLSPAQQIVKIVDEELTITLGSETAELNKSPKIPTVIMMAGLQGAGKTTFTGKLANYLKKNENARPLLIAGDVYRPAAIDQLKVLGQQLDVPVFDMGTEVSPVEIVRQGMELAKEKKNDYVLIDTAGRSHKNSEQCGELYHLLEDCSLDESITKENYLVLSATTKYKDLLRINDVFGQVKDYGLIFTKLDETLCLGNILNLRLYSGAPLSYLADGQSVPDDINTIDPQMIAKSILGQAEEQ